MKRNPRKLGWTKAFRRAHGKEMTVDSTLAFQQRRNIPVRYNREVVAKTLQAMQRVSEIRARRERKFYRERMKGNKARELEADRKLVAENQHLLPPKYRDEVKEVLKPMEVEVEQEELELDQRSQKLKTNAKRIVKLRLDGEHEIEQSESEVDE